MVRQTELRSSWVTKFDGQRTRQCEQSAVWIVTGSNNSPQLVINGLNLFDNLKSGSMGRSTCYSGHDAIVRDHVDTNCRDSFVHIF